MPDLRASDDQRRGAIGRADRRLGARYLWPSLSLTVAGFPGPVDSVRSDWSGVRCWASCRASCPSTVWVNWWAALAGSRLTRRALCGDTCDGGWARSA